MWAPTLPNFSHSISPCLHIHRHDRPVQVHKICFAGCSGNLGHFQESFAAGFFWVGRCCLFPWRNSNLGLWLVELILIIFINGLMAAEPKRLGPCRDPGGFACGDGNNDVKKYLAATHPFSAMMVCWGKQLFGWKASGLNHLSQQRVEYMRHRQFLTTMILAVSAKTQSASRGTTQNISETYPVSRKNTTKEETWSKYKEGK